MKKQLIPVGILLVVVMFLFAEYTGEKKIIFPETAALVLGSWVVKKSPWKNYCHLWLSPTMAALIGMAIIKIFPYSPLMMIAGTFILVVIQLRLMGSNVRPSLTAAILPIIIHAHSWYYPLSVCILTFIIALGKKTMDDFGQKESVADSAPENPQEEEKNGGIQEEIIYCTKLLIGVMLVSVIARKTHWLYMVDPPLIVAFVEMSKSEGALKAKDGLVFALLVLADFLGAFWLYLIYYFLHWPVWIAAGLATASVFSLFFVTATISACSSYFLIANDYTG